MYGGLQVNKDTGGAAFPVMHSIDGNWNRSPLPHLSGMTLRDYFAAKAMQSIVGNNQQMIELYKLAKENGMDVIEAACKSSYEYADGMIAERNKP